MKLTQKNFNLLCETLNHRVSNIEKNVNNLSIDIKWMKRIGWYMSAIITGLAGHTIII